MAGKKHLPQLLESTLLIGRTDIYHYKPQPMRTMAEIRADILALEQETEGLPGEIIGEAR